MWNPRENIPGGAAGDRVPPGWCWLPFSRTPAHALSAGDTEPPQPPQPSAFSLSLLFLLSLSPLMLMMLMLPPVGRRTRKARNRDASARRPAPGASSSRRLQREAETGRFESFLGSRGVSPLGGANRRRKCAARLCAPGLFLLSYAFLLLLYKAETLNRTLHW
ncbi:unnamed protein product [Menidia menidia]|uniref:(Atlantic silverside) hypothetical protein n=1 Tax=Menidia menidia TaxID=238744 RepID=A0A8S4AIJ4_9TELE|nr:unnamed protein product [Menidia menidia]